ncbi:copper homeostasis protein CutC [Rhodoferax fermentans]|uniref:copper homeostasis protein CutC n=2 Tax=Rhodoferax fermentans TaxID=28066 RepID=UPI00117A04CD|nr:copper homeostasis protein CutC [Rhodoferax fermentans]
MAMHLPSLLFEACVESFEAALTAQQRGAHRIELCSALDQDGLTPSHELVQRCVQGLSIPVLAMIRPRGGDFVYTEAELDQMERDIKSCQQAGVAGVVFGLLTEDGEIDMHNTERLVRTALPLAVTFHKAIDYSTDVQASFKRLNTLHGITRVLTSGGQTTAWEGRDALKAMHALPGRQIEIVAAGKLLPANRRQLADYTGVTELHGKNIV